MLLQGTGFAGDPVGPKVDLRKILTGCLVKAVDMILCLHPDLLVLRPRIFRTSLFVDRRFMLNRQFLWHYLECSHSTDFFYVLVHIVTAGHEEGHTF